VRFRIEVQMGGAFEGGGGLKMKEWEKKKIKKKNKKKRFKGVL